MVAGVAHFNHGLRGAAADADEAFCRDAGRRPRACRSRSGATTCARWRDAQHRSIEDAARTARYAFLERAADRLGADVIAVGHSARRSGGDVSAAADARRRARAGSAAIRPRVGPRVRPLIEIAARGAARVLPRSRGSHSARTRPTPTSTIPRNRVRHELMPYLEREFSPGNRRRARPRSGDRAGGRRSFCSGKQSNLAASDRLNKQSGRRRS